LSKIHSEYSELEGVIRIKVDIPFEVKFVCVHLFEIDGKRIMIDAGFNMIAWKKQFLKILTELNIKVQDIDYCIITHEHLDHCGLTKYLKRRNPDLQILMHKITDDSLNFGSDQNYHETMKRNAKKVAEEIIAYGMEQDRINRLVKSFLVWPKVVRYEPPTRILKDNDEIKFDTDTLKVIWTPGHSLGHICIFDVKRRFLFSGDHILSRITPHIGIYHISTLINETISFHDILKQYLKSLDKIIALKPKLILPSHQEIIENPHDRILEIKKHHNTRFKEIMHAIENRPLTPYQISQIHFGTDLDVMNQYLALNEVLSHLIYLENQGKVQKIEKDGKILYSTI